MAPSDHDHVADAESRSPSPGTVECARRPHGRLLPAHARHPVVVVAMPKLSADLHTDISTTVWVTSSYLLAYSVPLLLAGRLGDRFGAKRIYLIGMAVFTAASLLCGLATGIGQLIAFRALQGLGAAGMSPSPWRSSARPSPRRSAARHVVLGSGLRRCRSGRTGRGGLLVDSLGWRSIFLINVPIGSSDSWWRGASCPPCPAIRTASNRRVLISGLSLFCLVYGLENGSGYDCRRSPTTSSSSATTTGISVGVPRSSSSESCSGRLRRVGTREQERAAGADGHLPGQDVRGRTSGDRGRGLRHGRREFPRDPPTSRRAGAMTGPRRR
ncbi:MFS transporter [Streptomyces sp. T1317-0309]|nr:MFS transporter [Streptomyces sp. T1317-0309]